MNPSATPDHTRSTTRPEDFQRRHMDKVADAHTDAAGRSAGIPAEPAQLDRTPTDSPWTPKEASIKSSIRLPHERDEDTDMTEAATGQPPPAHMHLARQDLQQGRQDTSRARETDQAYHRLHEEAPAAPSAGPED